MIQQPLSFLFANHLLFCRINVVDSSERRTVAVYVEIGDIEVLLQVIAHFELQRAKLP